MQVSGVVKVKRHVLAENTTLHEPYKSVEVEFDGPVTILFEKPLFLDKNTSRFGVVAQVSPSGTIDLKLIPIDQYEVDEKEREKRAVEADKRYLEEQKKKRAAENETRQQKLEEERKNAARTRIISRRNAVTSTPNSVSDEELEAELDKMGEEDSKSGKVSKKTVSRDDSGLGEYSPIKADLTDDGDVLDETEASKKKTSGTKKKTVKK